MRIYEQRYDEWGNVQKCNLHKTVILLLATIAILYSEILKGVYALDARPILQFRARKRRYQ